jgi:hypothetical protein
MASMVVASMVVASMASSMAVLLAVLLLAPALPLLPAQTPPACDIWSARPCFGSQALDCAFRNLTREFGASLLAPEFGAAATFELEQAMQLGRYCPALRRTAPPRRPAPAPAADGATAAAACRHSAAASGKVFGVAAAHGGGDDSGVGSIATPFATLERAVAASREQRAAAGEGATIVLLPGTHSLADSTVELDARDSGLHLTGCDGAMPTLSAGAPLNPRGAWEAVPGQPGVSMMRSAFGGKAIDGLFLSSPAANDRLVRARHPNSNPERVIWPTGTAGAQYGASQYVGPDMIRYPESWLPPPAWQLVPPKLVEISEPNWNGVSGGLPPNVSFTSAGGMSPFYQARIGGPMDRFVGGINPGPTRTNCLLTAIGRPYPAGCAVPGGVKYEPAAFEGVVPPRNWSKVSSGLIHAIHPLGCPVEGQAVPWFDWWWRLSHVLQAPPPPPPVPPPVPPPPEQQCGLHKAVEGGCCGGMNVGPAHILPSFNASLCAELCCKDPKCGVAVMTSGQGSAGIKCFLTHMNSPGKSYQPVPAGGEKSLVILTRNGTVNVSSYDDRDSLVFGEGGWQSLQGSPVGSHFYVENIRELLDSEGEYYHDAETDTLYLWRNSTQEAQHGPNASYVGTVGESVLRIVGSASSPAADITVSNLRIRHTTTDFLAPHEAPGGGDQSAHRGAAIFVEGVRNVSITGCRFDRVDGSGVFVSNWARDVRILNNEFAFSGSAGIIVMGECELIDCTAGTHPQRTVIEGNLLHDGGVFSKNYLGGSIFMAKQAQSVVRGNAIWNTPRSCMTLNDGGMGGDEISANLMLNCNRETSDTGVIYTYNRLPLLSTTRTGEPSLIMQTRRIHSNLFFGNYGSGGGVDNDDGSSFYSEVGNVLYNLEVKHSTFTTGGHGKNTSRTLIVNDRGCDAGQGYFERFENNFCAMFRKPGNPPGGPLLPTQASCDPNHPTDTPDRPVPTPARSGNTYYVRNVSDWRYSCGGALWNLSEAQAHGVDVGSTVRPLGSEVEAAATFTAIARQLLGLSSPGPLRRLKSDDDPLMPWLLMPPWPPTYNLSQSTMTQSCFGPARIGKPPAVQPLTNKTGEFLRHWGIVTLDFESQEQIWGHHPGGKDSDTMMLAAAVQMKAIAPNTKIWVYR